MRSIKAILAGTVFVFVCVSLLGLAYIFIAVAYIKLAVDFHFLHDIAEWFRYLLGIPVFIATMLAAGYVTANVANMHTKLQVWLHCFAVGLITMGGMMYPALQNSNLTLTGIIVIILALSSSSAGGFYWLRNNEIKSPAP